MDAGRSRWLEAGRMPRYKIETMAQVRRVYIVEANNATDAENVLVNDEKVGK